MFDLVATGMGAGTAASVVDAIFGVSQSLVRYHYMQV